MACYSSLIGSTRALLVTASPLRLSKRRASPAQALIGFCSRPSLPRDRRWYNPHRMRKKWFRPSASLLDSTGVHLKTLLRGFGPCKAKNREGFNEELKVQENGDPVRRLALQSALWSAEAAYILWLFLLPYAPGDPVWSIKSETINDLLGLSLNFFFVLPILNSAGIHVIEAPVLHPVAEGLFNFVIGWTFMFAPLLFTDSQRDRYKGSLDVLWGLQMFLTNTFLIPYMAIRLNDIDGEKPPLKASRLGSLMTRGASVVGLIGAAICVTSALWALFGRIDDGFGGVADRWQFVQMYISSERLAYAFIWDIFLYSIFQPWLIGDNLQNVRKSNEGLVGNLRFVPVVGLVAYLLCLDVDRES